MIPLRHLRPFATKYMGRPASTHAFLFNSSKMGPRVVVIEWLDNGEAEVRACKGDGRSPKFQLLEEITLSAVDAACTDYHVLAEKLGDKHFARLKVVISTRN